MLRRAQMQAGQLDRRVESDASHLPYDFPRVLAVAATRP
jgi:hypothetical protein